MVCLCHAKEVLLLKVLQRMHQQWRARLLLRLCGTTAAVMGLTDNMQQLRLVPWNRPSEGWGAVLYFKGSGGPPTSQDLIQQRNAGLVGKRRWLARARQTSSEMFMLALIVFAILPASSCLYALLHACDRIVRHRLLTADCSVRRLEGIEKSWAGGCAGRIVGPAIQPAV